MRSLIELNTMLDRMMYQNAARWPKKAIGRRSPSISPIAGMDTQRKLGDLLDFTQELTVKCNRNIQSETMQGGLSVATTAKELPACPVETTLTLISDKWKVLILRDLMPGTKRFGELKKSIGSVSQKVLTAQLRQMEESGLLTRTVYPEVPPRVEYTLTELGYSLKPILDAMWTWGETYEQNQA